MQIGPALKWDELADIYFKTTGNQARIRPMDEIFAWAEKQTDKFFVHPENDTLHLILQEAERCA